mgnify:CR=1 FL=1
MRLNADEWDKAYRSGEDYTPVTDDKLDKILGYLPENGGNIAVDLGSGTGHLARELQSRGFSVTGLDLSYDAVKRARNQSDPMDIHYEVADFETDFSPKFGPADLVTAKLVYAFIQDRQRFLRNVKNLLKANGRFALVNPLKSNVPEHKKHIALETEQIVRELEDDLEMVDYYVDDGDEYFICRNFDDKT